MNKLKMKLYASIGLLIVAGVVAVGYGVKAFQTESAVSNVFENVGNLTISQAAPENKVSSDEILGLGGPVNGYNWSSDGGVKKFFGSMAMNSATTTVCAIQSPAATSTLSFASAVFDVSSTTASGIVMAKSATAFVTTTLLNGRLDLGANAKGLLLATTTIAINDQNVFAPSQWLVIGMQGGVGDFSPTGMCKAQFNSVY